MPSPNTWVIIFVMLIAICIAGISGSSYGLGLNNNDRNSPGYQASAILLSISIILCIVFIIALVVVSLYNTGVITASGMNTGVSYSPIPGSPVAPTYGPSNQWS